MGYIYCFYFSVPESETVIADNNINFIFMDYLFKPDVFEDYMIKKHRDFEAEAPDTGAETVNIRAETGEINIG